MRVHGRARYGRSTSGALRSWKRRDPRVLPASEEVSCGLVVAGGDGAELLELCEEVFDQVAGLVEVPVELARQEAVGLGRDHRRLAGGGCRRSTCRPSSREAGGRRRRGHGSGRPDMTLSPGQQVSDTLPLVVT